MTAGISVPAAVPTVELPAALAPVTHADLVASVAEPTPDPANPSGEFEDFEVSPGLLGFIPPFLIALACIGLFLSLTRQLRKVSLRQAELDAREAREAEAARGSGAGAPGAGPGGAGSGPAGAPGAGPGGAAGTGPDDARGPEDRTDRPGPR